MSEAVPGNRRPLGWVTMLAAVAVVVLAVGAALWPRRPASVSAHILLVYDSSGSVARVENVYEPLRGYLAALTGRGLDLVRVDNIQAFDDHLADRPDFVLVPDGLAVGLPVVDFLPLAVGRRPAPQNLRPRGVLVYRRSAGDLAAPWRTRPLRTVFGDSVSLTSTGVLRQEGPAVMPAGCRWGPDPYDHEPVLQALRLGAFDYAVVRQWDASRLFAEGLLSPAQFAVRDLVGPMPDVVLMVSRDVDRRERLRCSDGLSVLGRGNDAAGPLAMPLQRGLARLHLAGFNLLLEADFALVRKNYPGDWLQKAD